MNINLALVGFWLVLGIIILLLPSAGPDAPPVWTIPGTNISAGWLGILLAGYNLIRYFSLRARAAEHTADREFARQNPLLRHHDDERPVDPNFKFTDPSSGTPGEPR